MFSFFLKRYLYQASSQRGLFILALLPALLYLAGAAAQMDRFKIYQAVKIAPEAPLAVAGSPSEVTTIDRFLKQQDELFLDAYTLQTMGRELQKELPPPYTVMTEAQLRQSVKSAMSLSYAPELARITYSGRDRELGEFLTLFYAEKVIRKAQDGLRRQEMLAARQAQAGQKTAVQAGLKGGMVVESQRALWRSDRLPMTLALLAAGLAAVLVWIGMLEMVDPCFKSERQIARILRLPVLGTVPNVMRLSRVMGAKPK